MIMNENIPREPSGQQGPAATTAPTGEAAVQTETAAPEVPPTPDSGTTAGGEPGKPNPVPRSGRGLAALALLLAAVAMAGSAYVVWNQRQAAASINDGRAELTAAMSRLDSNTGQLASRIEAIESERSKARAERAAAEERLRGLDARTDELESNVARLARTREASGTQLRRAEAEQLLRIANYQLNLARNPDTALAALLEADAILAGLADPRLQPVRRQIADDLLALRSIQRVDLEGIALRLDSLARQVNQLPLNSDARELSGLDQPATPASGGWARFKQKVAEFVGGIFTVRRTESDSGPLLSRDEAFFLRRNLELELQAARLAVLSANTDVFRASLSAAKRWTEEYFDQQASSVTGFIRDLTALRGQRLEAPLPDISGSLQVFRELAERQPARPGGRPIDIPAQSPDPAPPESALEDAARAGDQ
jgi:uroporphyrin-3 C-methyltransferase